MYKLHVTNLILFEEKQIRPQTNKSIVTDYRVLKTHQIQKYSLHNNVIVTYLCILFLCHHVK